MGFWKFWSFQKLENSNFHRRYVLRKSILLKAMKLEKIKYSKFYWFCYRSLHEKLLKDVFWQKWWLLKALKFEKFQKKKFSTFLRCKFQLFWQKMKFLKVLKLEKLFLPLAWSKGTQSLFSETSAIIQQVGGRWRLRPPPTCEKCSQSFKLFEKIIFE